MFHINKNKNKCRITYDHNEGFTESKMRQKFGNLLLGFESQITPMPNSDFNKVALQLY